MRREAQAVVYVLLGAVLIKLVVSGEYLNYVRSILGPYLVLTGSVLIGFGVLGFARDWRGRAAVQRSELRAAEAKVRTHGPGSVAFATDDPGTDVSHADASQDDAFESDDDEPDHHGHDHGEEGHGVGWLWVLPVFLLVLVPPPALGSFAADRGAVTVPEPPRSTTFGPLHGSDPVSMAVSDYAQRAVWSDGSTLNGRTVELTGFVTPHSDGVWYITRMKISCCAADARPFQVQVVGSTKQVSRDAWVRVTGTWQPSTESDPWKKVPILRAVTVTPISAPSQPYE